MTYQTETKAITQSGDVAEIFRKILEAENEVDQKKEHFWAAGLDARKKIEYVELISLGTLEASLVHPREVFRFAILKGVASLVLAHNHPSGDAKPSREDITVTQRLIKAGEIIGIDVLDHVILTKNTHNSLREMGLIKEI